jgi:hypothetical protein
MENTTLIISKRHEIHETNEKSAITRRKNN